MKDGFLLQSIIYLTAAVITVPLAKRLGMGSVLGYLVGGILIGPFVMGMVGEEGKDIMHFAEFGVVMMLFLIGLELDPAKLWSLRKQVLGVGLLQVAGTTLVLLIAGFIAGLSWQSSLSIALALSMSSTAIVLQSLKEKGLMQTEAGQNSFAVLLFQDISVIPILAVLPLLAFQDPAGGEGHSGAAQFMHHLPEWVQPFFLLAAVGAVILAGRYMLVPVLRIIAQTHLRELFTACALLIVLAIAYLMNMVGLSPALGTFLGGVILANSEFKHELESDLEPFNGLLLGLLFMAVGASINFHLITEHPLLVLALTLGVMIFKMAILYAIGRYFRLSGNQNLNFSIGLCQVGEFAFVLFSFVSQMALIDARTTDIMMAVTALSMTITPFLFLLNEKILQSRIGTGDQNEKLADVVSERNRIIIAGFSHFGSTIGRFLRANGVEATILDNNSDQVDMLRKMGFKVFYGDATRIDLLESAGAAEAEIFIIAIDSDSANIELARTLQKHFPHLKILVRAKNRYDAYELIDLGIKNIYREGLDTSIRLGVDVLRILGHRAYTATRAGQNFIRYDEGALTKLSKFRHDKKEYISNVRKEIEQQEHLLSNDELFHSSENDHAWDSEFMRESINRKK